MRAIYVAISVAAILHGMQSKYVMSTAAGYKKSITSHGAVMVAHESVGHPMDASAPRLLRGEMSNGEARGGGATLTDQILGIVKMLFSSDEWTVARLTKKIKKYPKRLDQTKLIKRKVKPDLLRRAWQLPPEALKVKYDRLEGAEKAKFDEEYHFGSDGWYGLQNLRTYEELYERCMKCERKELQERKRKKQLGKGAK